MKILAFVDMHGSLSCLNRIVQKSKRADAIICAGDFTIFGRNTELILKKLNRTKIPTFIIHGNHEEPSVIKAKCRKYKNITFMHRRIKRFKDFILKDPKTNE